MRRGWKLTKPVEKEVAKMMVNGWQMEIQTDR